MLQPISDLPHGLLGFEATGEIHASDYRDVLHEPVPHGEPAGEELEPYGYQRTRPLNPCQRR
jgi:hypothetical protein